ncbi:MAG: sn-glycerol-3-phosphate ABC transporter ATP-binding protein UgpC, partial [Lachnospiraceae bacterium]|nr:sn-glycerol-3-phosphate ABC transporter ATP-binding protein UgpC [Lachnospiraceae bacterium]
MSEIQLEGVCKVYPNGVTAVKDFNLDVQDKEFIIFVGPSGCGKSTTLRMIAGLEDITDGTLKIDGKVMNNVEPKDRDIAMVFQNYALYPHMTVFDNMAFGLKLRKVPKDEIKRKVDEAADILGLKPYLDRKPKALSGGQRQRVAMGRAIVRNPKVFLMDEPLSNLDAKLRVQMRSEIASLHNRLKATIIYVTHDQTEAMTLGTRIVVLKDGVIMQVDSPQKLYNEPNNLFVAGFIGSPQMNFIDAVCKVEGERVTLNFEKTSVVLPPAKAKKLIDGGYNGKTVVMGIRPEDIGDSQIEIEAHKDATFETDVT